ncbi:MAG TPA: SDR family NAD(P)-dependent oxidoreductase, partial [Opitutaceae bacterium]|nr:SDR family NAD(P)-dependent oxidoreductase [Opitutaceae bacterium]
GMYARNRGALVNISSLAAEFPIPYMSGYNMVKAGLSALSESLMIEARGTKVIVLDFRPGDYRTDFNQAMQRSAPEPTQKTHREIVEKRLSRTWITLEKNLKAGPPPAHAANTLRDALLRGRSGVVRSGTFFQARLAPFLARLAPSALRRTAQARYFGIS